MRIVKNNDGEIIREFDTRAVKLLALGDTQIGSIKRGVMGAALMQSDLADGINIMESFALFNGLQKMLAEGIEENPEFEMLAKIFDSETVKIDEED